MARQLVAQGYELYIECQREYHSIFRICPYVMPVYPDQIPPRGFKFDHVIDPQIWPQRYQAYRRSKMKWWPFVTAQHPMLSGLEWSNPFEEALLPDCPLKHPEALLVIAHTGFSQVPKIEPSRVVELAYKEYPDFIPVLLGHTYRATDLCDLVSLVKQAAAVVTINTSVDFMADSFREQYDHVICSGFGGQDDFESPKQTRHSL
jgi:hypothetical protein